MGPYKAGRDAGIGVKVRCAGGGRRGVRGSRTSRTGRWSGRGGSVCRRRTVLDVADTPEIGEFRTAGGQFADPHSPASRIPLRSRRFDMTATAQLRTGIIEATTRLF